LKFIPVIVIANASEGGEKDRFLEHELLNHRGAAGFLTKPFDFNTLLDLLRRHVRLSTGPSKSQKIRMVQ